MKKFNTYIDAIDMTYWRELCSRKGTLTYYRKGEPFVWCGDLIKHFGFIRKGYFKYTLTNAKGDESITGFAFEGCIVGDFLSTMHEKPIKTNIIAATDAEVMQCPASELKCQLENSPVQYRMLAEGLFNQAYTQYLSLHTLSPKARYLALLNSCPELLQNITLKELASYLQITPTHLSRIRKELTFADSTSL